MITVLTLLSLGCILAYTLSVCIKFKGIPNSISASFYSLEYKYWFRFTMWVAPFLLLPAILEISKPNTEFLAFLAIVGMIIVGCFPDYVNDRFAQKGHEAGAIITMVFSQTWVGFNYPYLLALWFFYIVGTMYFILKHVDDVLEAYGYTRWNDFVDGFFFAKPLFWVEVTCILSTFASVILILEKCNILL